MKKLRSLLIGVLAVATVAAVGVAFAGCGSSSDKEIDSTYQYYTIQTVTTEYEYEGQTGTMENQIFTTDNVVLYTDGTYMSEKTVITTGTETDGSTSIQETETAIRYGTYTKGTTAIDDTYIKLDLSAATRVIWMANVYNGMFIKGADSDNYGDDVTYIGDDVTIISKDQFMSDYGAATTYYIVLDMDMNEQQYIVDSM
ncbi:MAG: hypothetical protein LUD50_07365 [Clostridia bacterium]|nr:hypothetical protein [Clostridia bacterium]